MISFVLLASFQAPDLILQRGLQIEGSFAGLSQKYWDVQEAEIDEAAPKLPIPTMFALTGDAKRKVLIRFGGLDLAIKEGYAITGGTIELSLVDADQAGPSKVRLLKRPWATPGINVLAKRIKPRLASDTKPIFAPGVSWSHAGGDVAKWQEPGAAGTNDSEIINAPIVKNGSKIEIKIDGAVLEKWRKQQGSNNGIMLEFDSQSAIWGSTSPEARPKLSLSLEKSETKSANVGVVRSDNSIQLTSNSAISEIEAVQAWQTVYKGEPKSLPVKGNSSEDPRGRLMSVFVKFKDPLLQDQMVQFDPQGTDFQMSAAEARLWNQWTVDQSPYSFAPFGAQKYVNPYLAYNISFKPERLLVKPGFGSNLSDAQLLSALVPPVRPTDDPLFQQIARPVAGPLTLFEVANLVNGAPKFPEVVIAKLVNSDGLALPKTTLTFEGKEYVSDDKGFAVLDRIPDGTIKDFTVQGKYLGSSDEFSFPSWHISDLAARGNTKAISIQIPFNLSVVEVIRDVNLAKGKPITDSAGSFPAQILGLNDDNELTKFTLKPGQWVQIDIGRDRLIAEFDLLSQKLDKFEVLVYGTGEKPEDGDEWLSIDSLAEFQMSYPKVGNRTILRPTPIQGRYFRIINRGSENSDIFDVKLFAGKRN